MIPADLQVQSALGHWAAVAAAEPTRVDARYHAGYASYRLHRFEEALAWWQQARALAPDDFQIQTRIVQAQNALGRHAAASQSLARLRRLHAASDDAQLRAQEHVIIDRFAVARRRVRARARLGPLAEGPDYLYAFEVLDTRGATVMTVQLETSAFARRHGVPCLLAATSARGHRVLDHELLVEPSYAELKQLAIPELELAGRRT